MPIRTQPMTLLRSALPYGYIKTILNELDFNPSEGLIYAVANGRRKNAEIQERLYWLALENTLGKFFTK